ncbi:salivary peroxidase/catechol oxidase-like isoform X2 [Tachypleus tridentatus]|uniref:salivary peroxidase/catechol oxidase-like isoform X2 n=1 Tax=Tachypleus tridentatus TaxID=6853 RepID=UPI003FD0F7AD
MKYFMKGTGERYFNATDPYLPTYFMILKLHENTYRITGEYQTLFELYKKIAKMKSYSLRELISFSESQLYAELDPYGYKRPPQPQVYCDSGSQYRTMDGTCNNLHHFCWGATNIGLKRLLPPDYADGVEEPRRSQDGDELPNPRFISLIITGTVGHSQENSYEGATAMVAHFSQFLSHDMSLIPPYQEEVTTQHGVIHKTPKCCGVYNPHKECYPIYVVFQDPKYTEGGCMEFVRSLYVSYTSNECYVQLLVQHREQVIVSTSFIDASNIYGSSQEEAKKLRSEDGNGAKLLFDTSSSYLKLLPRDIKECRVSNRGCDSRCFRSGDPLSTLQPAISSLTTLFSREHNRLVDLLSNSGWEPEKLYQEVRKIIGAILQHITDKHLRPLILGEVYEKEYYKPYFEYDEALNPTTYNSFTAGAFRLHSMVQDWIKRKDVPVERSPDLVHDFFRQDEYCDLSSDPVTRVLVGITQQYAQKVGYYYAHDMKHYLMSSSRSVVGIDMLATDIQRGRDHGLPSYVRWREWCKLKPITNFEELENEMLYDAVEKLKKIYKRVEDIDLIIGGTIEKHVQGGLVGPTFACLIARQFATMKYGDRFWYEHLNFPGAFTEGQLNEIKKTTLAALICRNTDEQYLQRDVFRPIGYNNSLVPCQQIKAESELDLSHWSAIKMY